MKPMPDEQSWNPAKSKVLLKLVSVAISTVILFVLYRKARLRRHCGCAGIREQDLVDPVGGDDHSNYVAERGSILLGCIVETSQGFPGLDSNHVSLDRTESFFAGQTR